MSGRGHLAIIAVSDLHIGFYASNKAAFIRFLGKLQSDPNVTDLVLLGDIVDMRRRDSSGVFLEITMFSTSSLNRRRCAYITLQETMISTFSSYKV